MTTPWQPISDVLKQIYKEQKISRHFMKDEAYLKEAYEFTEKLWEIQLEKTEKLNAIMISESPLFGEIKRYIYNPHTAPSVFFYFKDLEALLDDGEELVRPRTTVEQKQMMFEKFQQKGFITLDIFPFALNPSHTAINYQKMSKNLYHQLLEVTTENYLIPKLTRCLERSHQKTHFVYRYKRLYDKTEHHFESVLNQLSPIAYKIDTVHKNMSLDREKLRRLVNHK